MSFDSTVAGETANSFASVEYADAYFAFALYGDEWNTLASTGAGLLTKQRALVEATRRLNSENWRGYVATNEQALQFPRSGVYDEMGRWLTAEAIPNQIKDATCELALEILKANPANTIDESLAQFSKIAIGSLSFEMRNAQTSQIVEGRLPDAVTRLVRHFIYSGTRLVRG